MEVQIFKQSGTGAIPRTLAEKAAEIKSPGDFGASGNGSDDDSTPIASIPVDAHVPAGTYYGPNGFSMAAVRYRGAGSGSLLKTGASATQGVVIQSGTTLDTLNISHQSATNCAVLGAAGGVVSNSTISAAVTSAVEFVGPNPVGSHVRFSNISAPTFGVLVNTQGQTNPTGSKASAIGNDISTVNGDAVEWNAPSVGGVASFKGTFTAFNWLENTAATGPNSAGFNIGIAGTLYNAVGPNVHFDSRLENIHVEDSQRCTTFFGNVGAGRADGFRVAMGEAQNSMPVSCAANALENSNATPTGTGFNMYWYTPGSLNGCVLAANGFRNYNIGLYAGGVATGNVNCLSGAYANVFQSCNYGVGAHGNQNQGTVRQAGTNLLIGSSTRLFLTEAHSVRFGKLITDQNSSGSVPIQNTGAGGYNSEIPSMCDGFEYPATPLTATTGGVTQKLFTVGGPFHGRVKCQFKGVSPVTDWCHLSADINWDGTTFTSSNVLSRVHGQVSSITLGNSSGSPQVTIVSTANTLLQAGWIEFDGEYWDA